jgi:hypothetical protein
MSLDLDAVGQVMYVRKGEVNSGNKAKVVRLENKLSIWYCGIVGKVINKSGSTKPMREAMSTDLF